jgi:uncharacterized NAD(P)/FAD-binding protein YdhS
MALATSLPVRDSSQASCLEKLMHRRICIIGGGYSGAAAAIQFAKQATASLEIMVVEPRAAVGGGTAYSTSDPAVRLNVEDSLMVVHTDALDSYSRWLDESGARFADPEGVTDDGEFFARRDSFGRYMADEIAQAATANVSGSLIRHCQDHATGFTRKTDHLHVSLASGGSVSADMIVLALGNERPAALRALPPEVLAHPACLADPWTAGGLDNVEQNDRVLLVGSGLTSVDVIASLTRRGHQGRIDAISRRGLLPLVQGEFPGIAELLRRSSAPVPALVQQHGEPETVAEVLRWVRADARASMADGRSWRDAFDRVRDAAKYVWPRLSLTERRRFFRHLKPFYDCHRFRLAPQISKVIEDRRTAGTLSVKAARVVGGDAAGGRLSIAIRARHQTEIVRDTYDRVINCTGPNPDPAQSQIGLLRDALSDGLLTADPTGIGLAVNERCETLQPDGSAATDILALGPLTRGYFGEVVAVAQITMQLVPLTQRLVSEGRI